MKNPAFAEGRGTRGLRAPLGAVAADVRGGSIGTGSGQAPGKERTMETSRAKRVGHPPFDARVASARAAMALGGVGLGALAAGAMALAALAIGALAIGRLAVKRGTIGHLKIEELEVGRLRVRELVVEQEQTPERGAS